MNTRIWRIETLWGEKILLVCPRRYLLGSQNHCTYLMLTGLNASTRILRIVLLPAPNTWLKRDHWLAILVLWARR